MSAQLKATQAARLSGEKQFGLVPGKLGSQGLSFGFRAQLFSIGADILLAYRP